MKSVVVATYVYIVSVFCVLIWLNLILPHYIDMST